MRVHANTSFSARGIGVLALVCGGLFAGRGQAPATEIARLSGHREVSVEPNQLAAA